MLDKLKSGLALIAGWLAAAGLVLLWLLSRRRPNARPAVHVEPKKVPDAMSDVEKELKKRGLIRD